MCRRDWFLNTLGGYGSLAEHKLAWGGGDMFLGLKSWMLGFENWAVPTRSAIHIGPLPSVARKFWKYRKYSDSGQHGTGIGYLVALYVLGGEKLIMSSKFQNFMNDKHGIKVNDLANKAKKFAQKERKRISNMKQIDFDAMWQSPPWKTKTTYQEAQGQLKKKVGNTVKALKIEDWDVLKDIVEKYNVKSVLEFGAGISTVLLQDMNIKVTSIESNADYLAKLDPLLSNAIDVQLWDNKYDINFN